MGVEGRGVNTESTCALPKLKALDGCWKDENYALMSPSYL